MRLLSGKNVFHSLRHQYLKFSSIYDIPNEVLAQLRLVPPRSCKQQYRSLLKFRVLPPLGSTVARERRREAQWRGSTEVAGGSDPAAVRLPSSAHNICIQKDPWFGYAHPLGAVRRRRRAPCPPPPSEGQRRNAASYPQIPRSNLSHPLPQLRDVRRGCFKECGSI